MILSVERLRELLPSETESMSDDGIRDKLESLETLIRKYTNNNFQVRSIRTTGEIVDCELTFDKTRFKDGDTFQISQSLYNDGVYTVGETYDFIDESGVLITKVVYPPDVVMGAVNLFKWETQNREKVGVKSESLSRYSVTYYDLETSSVMGYPKGLMAFLKPYMRAKF